jgi:hypothetical protein
MTTEPQDHMTADEADHAAVQLGLAIGKLCSGHPIEVVQQALGATVADCIVQDCNGDPSQSAELASGWVLMLSELIKLGCEMMQADLDEAKQGGRLQ